MAFSVLGEPGKGTNETQTLTGSRIVFSFTVAYAVISIIAFVVAVSIYLTGDMTSGISACQGLFVFTVCTS